MKCKEEGENRSISRAERGEHPTPGAEAKGPQSGCSCLEQGGGRPRPGQEDGVLVSLGLSPLPPSGPWWPLGDSDVAPRW